MLTLLIKWAIAAAEFLGDIGNTMQLARRTAMIKVEYEIVSKDCHACQCGVE